METREEMYQKFYDTYKVKPDTTMQSYLESIEEICGHAFFAILQSSVHMAWMRHVGGRLDNSYRYSATIVYNNFPFPEKWSTDWQTVCELAACTKAILDSRDPNHSLAWNYDHYDKKTMPEKLKAAHEANDRAVLRACGWPEDLTEPEIVQRLMAKYAELTGQKYEMPSPKGGKRKGGKSKGQISLDVTKLEG